MLVVAVVVASPGLLGFIETGLARPLWIAVYAVFLVAVFFTFAATTRFLAHVALAVAVLSSWVLVATAFNAGLLHILLVLTAAISVYVVPIWASGILVVLNSVFLAVVGWNITGFSLDLTLGVGFYLLIQCATVLSSFALLREQQLRRELATAHLDLQAASALLAVGARSSERLRISRDLHDAIGHQLTVLNLELEAAKHRDADDARRHVERASTLAKALLGDVRDTVGRVRSEAPTLAAALEPLVQNLPGLDVHLELDPRLQLDEERTEALVRTVQEILTNTLKHAGARRSWITIRQDPEDGRVTLSAVDDGRGAPRRATDLGQGLQGIAERFEALGGRARFDGTTGDRGFRVTTEVPAP
ncbi:MAG: two-component sensor histidine kinase [Propionibacterium sp.]|nr:two-component sensor histidine kinase [Propionibacterium sp.]